MARFMVTAMPFTGHVTPLRAVAAALVSRGHDVRVYTGGAFRDRVESTGASLVPWRAAPDFDENDLSATFPRLVGKKGIRQLLINVQDLFIKTSPAQVEDLTTEWEREPWDAIAGDEVSVGTALLRRADGLPLGHRRRAPAQPRRSPGPAERDGSRARPQPGHESAGCRAQGRRPPVRALRLPHRSLVRERRSGCLRRS